MTEQWVVKSMVRQVQIGCMEASFWRAFYNYLKIFWAIIYWDLRAKLRIQIECMTNFIFGDLITIPQIYIRINDMCHS